MKEKGIGLSDSVRLPLRNSQLTTQSFCRLHILDEGFQAFPAGGHEVEVNRISRVHLVRTEREKKFGIINTVNPGGQIPTEKKIHFMIINFPTWVSPVTLSSTLKR